MSEFDSTDYFNRRLQELNAAEIANPLNTRLANLARVSAEKQAVLGSQIEKERKRLEINKASVAAKLGLNPDQGMGAVVNTAVATASEAVDLPLSAAAALLDAAGQKDSADALREIANNDSGTAVRRDTNERQSGLVRRLGDAGVAAAKGVIGLGDAVVGVGDIATLGLSGKGWDALGRDSKTANRMLDELYSPEQRLANQKVDDAVGFLGTLETMLDNPSNIPKGIIESLPSMLAGGKIGQEVVALFPKVAALVGKGGVLGAGAASAIGEGALMAGSQAEEIRQQTEDGRLTFKQALLSAGTGVMGGLVAKAGGAAAAKLGVGDIDTALVAGKLAKSPRGYATSVGLSAGLESGEEAVQSMGETILQNVALDRDPFQGVGKAAAQGILTAAPLGAVGGLGERVKQEADAAKTQKEKNDVQAAAIASGDVSALMDKKNAAYDPARAVAALAGNSGLDTVAPEAKQANLEKASEIVAALQKERDEAAQAYETMSPQAVESYKAKLVNATAAGATDEVTLLQELIADAKDAPAQKKRLDALDTRLASAQEQLNQFSTTLNSGEVDVAAEVATINTKVDAADTKAVAARDTAVKKLITLSMAVPERLDTKVAESLASNMDNGLTEVQRDYLRKFSAARVAENELKTLSKVAQEIYTGGNGNLGISDHRQRVTAALSAGNKALADKHMSVLQNFEEDHRGKATAVAEAMAQREATGKNVQVIRNKRTKTWEINTGTPLNRTEARANGAVTVHMNTPESLVESFQVEAKAITQALAEMKAAYAVKFSPVQGASNVQVVPQAPASNQAASSAQQASPVVGSPAQAPGVIAGPAGAVAANPVVEPTGVDLPKGTKFEDITDSGLKLNLYRGEGAGNLADGAWWTFDRAEAEKYAKANNGQVKTLTMTAGEIANQTAQGQGGSLHRVFPSKADVGVIGTESSQADTSTSSAAADTQASTDAAVSETTTSAVEGQNQSTESTVSEKAQASPESVEPTLAVMSKESPEGTAYAQRELIGDFFTQTASREGAATKRPLADMKDFLSNGWDSIMSYVKFAELTEAQVNGLSTFWDAAGQWSKTIQANLFRKKNREYWAVDDLMQFFINEDGDKLDLDENVKTALSYAAFSWVAENATRSTFNTDEEINLILGRDEDTAVEEHERRVLGNVGTRQNVVANSLGQRAVQALGLKAIKGAPADLMPKLESAMGAHVFKLLMDEGILQRTEVPADVMASLTGSESTGATHQFLKLARDSEGNLNQAAEQIFQANKGTQGVLDKLFGVEAGMKAPTLEPVKFSQATTRNTNQGVPKKLAEVMQHENDAASYVRQDMYHLASNLDENILLQIAGGITVDPAEAHKANRLSNEAKNDGLLREIKNIKEFLGGLVSQDADLAMPLYFEHTVWKQQRVGISTNVVNPQTSKIHRHMLFRKTWETKVNMQDATQMENFLLRVAEGLGVKTGNQSNDKSLAELQGKLADPRISAAGEVLMKSLAGEELTEADQETLLAGVQAGKENMHSLDAIMALAHWGSAAKANKTEFTVQMMGEVDGVTNGPMLSHLLMGASATVKDLFGLLNRGGFYEVGNEHNQYNLWRGAEGHFDLYETTAAHMVREVQGLINTGIKSKKGKTLMSPGTTNQVMQAIYGFTGTLADKDGKVEKAGRNIIKTPLTAMVFGSSVGKAVESMANKFIESIYAGIEDTRKGKSDAQTPQQLVENINLLITQGFGQGISPRMSIEQLMEYEFSKEQTEALKTAFKLTVGAAVKTTMETDFAEYIAQRQQFNLAAQVSFELYDAVHRALREQLVADLVKSGDIAINPTTGKPLHDLTPAQEGELRKRLNKMAPVLHTLMSKDSGSLKSGLYMSKSGKKLSTEAAYQGEVRFGTPFKDNGNKSTNTRGYQTIETNPTVSMAPMAVHSLDSAISHYAAALGDVLNVHDAHGAGLANFEQTAKTLNEQTWKAMLNYSPASEMQASLSRVVVGLAELLKDGSLPPAAKSNLIEAINKIAGEQDIPPAELVGYMMESMKASAFKADSIKLEALGQMQAIDQYALQGGNYVVTDKDRADAAARRAALSDALTQQEKEAVAAVEAALQELPKKELPKVEVPLEQDPPKVKPNPFGEVGTPKRVNQDLVSFFKANPTASADKVLTYLMGLINPQNQETATAYHVALLQMLMKAMPKGVTVKLVTPEMTAADVKGMPKTPSFGWIYDNEIYILSDGFVNSGLQTAEVLLHELVHGAVMQVIENPGKAAKALVEDLERLMAEAKKYAKQNGIADFDSALDDVHEFVAYGMTRTSFQRMLAQVSVPESTKSSVLINGFKKFINLMTDLVFKQHLGLPGVGKKEQANTALGQLIKNVSGLANQAEKDKGISAPAGPVLSMSMDPVGVLNTYSTLDIHNSLNAGDVTPEFDLKLRGILGGIVEKMHGPFGAFKAALMQRQAMTPVDVWHKALATGVAPFASSVQGSPFTISEQEAHAMEQVEATVRAALQSGESTATSAYRELNKLFTEAAAIIKPSDLSSQAAYDFLFNVTLDANNNTRSNHLARFAAFGLANQEVNRLLQKGTKATKAKDTKSIAERLVSIWESLVELFHEKITGTYAGQRADIKLERLIENLVDIEAKKRIEIARRAGSVNFLAPLEDGAKNLATSAVQKVVDIAESGFVKNNSKAYVRAAGSLVSTLAQNRADAFVQEMLELRSKHYKDRLGIWAGTLNYAVSGSKALEALLRARKSLEGDRKDVITRRSKMALQAFVNQGKDIDPKSSASITQVFMRTAMHVLTGSFNMKELENLLTDKQAMNTAISDLENQLSGFTGFKDDFIHQANALAYFKVTGRIKAEVMMMNAHNIARLYGTRYVGKLTEAQSQQAEPIIEKLIALYAITYIDQNELHRAKKIFEKENARTDGQGNGVEFVLALHKKFEEESKARLFAGQQALMTHGYTSEIYSPHIDIVTAPESEGEALKRRGYTEGALVKADPADPDQSRKRLYVLEGGGLMPYLTGIVSYSGLNAKGTKQHSGYMNVNTDEGLANASLQAEIMHNKQRSLAKGPRPDMSKAQGSFMAPVVNPQGQIVNWRYMMQDSTKDTVLKRENRFNVVLGTLGGSIFDKETTTEVNVKVFNALKEDWVANGALTPESFILVGPKSPDADARETWAMLPDETKAQARGIWGKDGIYVRNNVRDIVFGYRKLSLADAVRTTQKRRSDDAEREARGMAPIGSKGLEDDFQRAMSTFFTKAVEHALVLHAQTRGYKNPEQYGERAAVLVSKGERMWQEIVGETKDLLVIKTVTVMVGNLKSNLSLLVLSGIPIKDIIRDHLVAWRGATAYQRDTEELDRLQTLVDTNQVGTNAASVQSQIARLKDSIARNPVKDLIEAGLMPTIVEDASADEDIYSYKSALVHSTDELVNKLHPLVKDAAKNVYLARDTKAYQTLRQITQLSDFMARYTQYQYLTTRKENKLSKEDAIQQSSDDFINYDIPMHRGMQYLDDMGIMPFMKYFLRIQKVLGRLSKDNPARVLGALFLGQFVNLGPIVLDSSWIHHAGNNPLHWGALQYPGALDELATVSAAASLVK